MNQINLALGQINALVGNLRWNADHLVDRAREAHARQADLVVFPELALSGYPPEDLVLKPHFIRDCAIELDRMAGLLPPELLVIAGAPIAGANRPCNAAVLFYAGKRLAVYRKMLLPNYGVFDEKRVFEPGDSPLIIELNGAARIGLHICEDSWELDEAPVRACAALELDLLINLSGSPYYRGKGRLREKIFSDVAARLQAPVAFCNLVGGQDELVFDGDSLVVQPDGSIPARAARFQEALLCVDLPLRGGERRPAPSTTEAQVVSVTLDRPERTPRPPPALPEPLSDEAEVYEALKLGLRDYVEKNGFHKTLIALSGGIDSALVAVLAVDALGADRVIGVTMPSQYSSSDTQSDAARLAENLGIEFLRIPIRDLFERFLETLKPCWPKRAPDVAEENLQARIRGTLIMALSNKFGRLVLATGNKSELATGYCTLYGDMAGGFAVIKDVPKTLVYALSRWRNNRETGPVIPAAIIQRPPSAELRPDQKDSDSLPPYDVLDPILEHYVERDRDLEAIVAEGFDPAVVERVTHLVDLNEYKRRQAPPGIKITPKAFGRDRRVPITNQYRNRASVIPTPDPSSDHAT